MKKKVVLITHSEFWRQGAGFWARTREIVVFLSLQTELSICLIKPLSSYELKLVEAFKNFTGINFRFICPQPTANQKLTLSELKKYINKLGDAEVYIVDKTENSLALNVLPKQSRWFVDTHDLICQRTKSAKQFKAFSGEELTEKQEIDVLKNYDRVICIQEEDFLLVSKWLGKGKAILTPHPVKFSNQILNQEVKIIGFIASKWFANVEGLKWFIKDIWRDIYRPGLQLNVFGSIYEVFENFDEPGVNFLGLIPKLEDIYSKVDIVINPVRWGAGLKIKTLEAMGNGLPLVTTTEGARGLMSLSGKAFLIADTAYEFIKALNELISNYDMRQSLGKEGYSYTKMNLSPESCFRNLLDEINN